MTLILNNQDIASVLTMKDTMDALEQAYQDLARGQAVCRPRIDIRIPTADPDKTYQWARWRAARRCLGTSPSV